METKKTYVKPEVKFFPVGSLRYTVIMAALNAQLPEKQEDHHMKDE